MVTATAFTFVAQDLAAFRATELPGVAAPAAMAVTVDDIYDNFSGGQKDPLAIRNYLKWVYEQSAHRLKYVCLLGNASRDFRNYRGRTPLVTGLVYLRLIWSGMLAWIFFNEIPDGVSLLGMLLVVGCGLAILGGEVREPRAVPAIKR